MPRSPSARRRPAAKTRQDIVASVVGRPWSITPQGLEEVLALAERELTAPTAVDAKPSTRPEGSWAVSVRDGIAQLHIYGPLVSADSWMRWYGLASYEDLALEFDRVRSDAQIKAIVLTFSTPGGHVHGCHELARIVRAARGEKPLVAFVEGDACSAGYWLASACDRIVAADTAVLGCLGVQVAYLDDARWLEAHGLREVVITSSQTPEKNRPVTEDEGRAQVQLMVDDLAAVFLRDVAANRGVPLQDVQARFGAGAVLVGQRAVAAGLADAIGTYEQLHAELLAGGTSAARSVTSPQETVMRTRVPKGRRRASPSAAAFESNTEVQALVTRDVGVAEGDIGTVAEIRDGTFYAVRFGDGDDAGTYAWLAEDELELASNTTTDEQSAETDEERDDQNASDDEDEDETASDDEDQDDANARRRAATGKARRVASAFQQAVRAAQRAERQRILGILKLRSTASLDALLKCAQDPTCTPEAAAHRVLTGGVASKHGHLTQLAGDEAALAAHGGAPNPNGPRAGTASESDKIVATLKKFAPSRVASGK